MGKYTKSKNRQDSVGGFLALPHTVLKHPNFVRLSGNATKLLILLGSQYRGTNNGDLSATWKQAQKFGIRSPSTLAESKRELLHYRLIILTRAGGKNTPALYAITWQSIDNCKGKLHVKETNTAPGDWKEVEADFIRKTNRKK